MESASGEKQGITEKGQTKFSPRALRPTLLKARFPIRSGGVAAPGALPEGRMRLGVIFFLLHGVLDRLRVVSLDDDPFHIYERYPFAAAFMEILSFPLIFFDVIFG
jgi:hypothetical protein